MKSAHKSLFQINLTTTIRVSNIAFGVVDGVDSTTRGTEYFDDFSSWRSQTWAVGDAQTQTITYGYDPLNRLTSATSTNGDNFQYTYDAVGNRLTETTAGGVTLNYVYDDANRLTSVDGTTYTWDNNGNLLSDGTSIYTYNHSNQLTGVSQGGVNYSYAYDGLGNRLRQTVGSTVTNYLLDTASGLSQVLADGINTYLYGLGRISQSSASSKEYYLGDALGSVRQMANASGGIVLSRNYEPFGTAYNEMGSSNTAYGFTGEWTDGTGLVNLRARYYAPYLNQFIQPDPIVPDPDKPWEWNRYPYARNNPVNFTDPSGLCVRGDQPCLKAAQKLFEDYGWYFVGQWQVAEIELLRDAAKEIAEFFDDHGGNGQARMRGAMSPAWFTGGSLPWIISGYHHVQAQTVFLLRGFSKEAVIHESAHVLDNLAGSGFFDASIRGGGPSDEMARSLGVDPAQCFFRFSCSKKYVDLLKEAGAELPPSEYARNGPSEDFAVTFEYLVTGNGAMQKAPVRSDWMARFIEGSNSTRPAYQGNPYQYLWFLPQPIPVPECSLPQVLVTPQP